MGEMDIKFTMADEVSKDLDPVVRILVQRTLAMRRETAKKQEIEQGIKGMVSRYRAWEKAREEIRKEEEEEEKVIREEIHEEGGRETYKRAGAAQEREFEHCHKLWALSL